ncbi:protein transport protein HofC [Erwinia sp. MMLR14_017]|uniref:protein transport protein HofC n=1 Tax=Erwinia sp. MMLR14_017 TaxID=3093842 RepID=UPI00298FCB91|nr:protein transport protein HofC [Erwinia sp. MMLR14_017]MDW8844756.1 protein transport protein HofC [Erwinia sp. MMLR14_017]
MISESERFLFRWQALTSKGELHRGACFCQDQQEVMENLLARALTPLTLSSGRRVRASAWQLQHKISLFRQLATLLKAGMTLSASLSLIAEDHAIVYWQALLGQLKGDVAEGVPFSEALARWPGVFPPLYPALMSVGEMTGRIDECCLQLAGQQERQHLLQKKVNKALRYPLFILALALVVSTGMLIFVLPEFMAVYSAFDAPLPTFTAAVVALSHLLQRYGLALLMVVAVSGMALRWQTRRSPHWQKRLQRWLLALPLIGRLYQGGMLSQIFMTLALTQHAGLTLLQSLQAVERTLADRLWREAVQRLQHHIAGGHPLHQALKQHTLFTALCYQLLKVGEESGSLDSMLTRLGNLHEETTQELADNLAAALEPLMMVVTGLLVGALVIAMYLPIFNLGDTLG